MGTLVGCEMEPAGPERGEEEEEPPAVLGRSAEESARDWDWADLGCIIAICRLDNC